MPSHVLQERIHILPGSLARSPGHVTEHFQQPMAAVRDMERILNPCPQPLLSHWQARRGGHIVINASRHDYVRGEQAVGRHRYEDVAWIQLIWFQQPQMYLLPAAWLILDILGWERDGEGAALLRFGEFRGAVARGFAAGYGQSSDAQRDASAYLAEGIARYLTAKGALNVADPRLQKLLAATVFDPGAYKSPPGEDGGG